MKKPTKKDLVYLEESPDFCEYNPVAGSLGTKGRQCVKDGYGLDGCNLMCCGRGYYTTVEDIREDCDCKFVWCCRVDCKTCTHKVEKHFCNWGVPISFLWEFPSKKPCELRNHSRICHHLTVDKHEKRQHSSKRISVAEKSKHLNIRQCLMWCNDVSNECSRGDWKILMWLSTIFAGYDLSLTIELPSSDIRRKSLSNWNFQRREPVPVDFDEVHMEYTTESFGSNWLG